MSASNTVFNAFYPFFSDKNVKIEEVGTESMPFPSFPLALIKDLLQEAEDLLSKDLSNVAYIDGDIFVVGDIHGNIRDLLRILTSGSPPPNSRYLFLGDYVDRGDYSLESITLLLALKVKFPHHIILLRGNHEYESINEKYGFMKQVIALYGPSGIYESFNRIFSYFKIAAIVANETLCVHGGLSPLFTRLSQLDDIDKTLNPPCDLLNDIIWSDPSDCIDGIVPSNRGNGYVFGYKYLNQFLNNNNLVRLIRGHECVTNGVKIGFESKIVTVFSSCNYQGKGSNQCGIIKILEDGSFIPFNFPNISILKREDASFNKVCYEPKNHKINCMVLHSPSLNNVFQTHKMSKRNNVGRIPLSGSFMKMKTMRTKRSNSQLNDSLPNLKNTDDDSINSNDSFDMNSADNINENNSGSDEYFADQKISLQSLSPKSLQSRSNHRKGSLLSISKSHDFL